MNYKAMTGIFIVVSALIAIGYDVWVYSHAGTEGTISYWIYDMSHDHPSIPFVMGYICGHFFWQMKKKR